MTRRRKRTCSAGAVERGAQIRDLPAEAQGLACGVRRAPHGVSGVSAACRDARGATVQQAKQRANDRTVRERGAERQDGEHKGGAHRLHGVNKGSTGVSALGGRSDASACASADKEAGQGSSLHAMAVCEDNVPRCLRK